jgi:hypothetical protein
MVVIERGMTDAAMAQVIGSLEHAAASTRIK